MCVCVRISAYLCVNVTSSGAMPLPKIVDKFKMFHVSTVVWDSGSVSIPIMLSPA